MILSEIIKFLDTIFKKELALEGDNCGLLIGRTSKDISKILVALDATDEVIDEAIKLGADLLLVHHPLIFDPLKTIISNEKIQLKILRLVENGIAVYAAHTNYDIMPGGLNQLIAEKIGLKNIEILEPLCSPDKPESRTADSGIGRIGNLGSQKMLPAYLKELKELLELENFTWLSASPTADLKRIIKRAAIIGGSANSCTDYLVSSGFVSGLVCENGVSNASGATAADAVIVGELKHSNALKIAESGIIVIAIGHAESEKFAIAGMSEILKSFLESNNLNNDIEVLKSKTGYLPWRYYFE